MRGNRIRVAEEDVRQREREREKRTGNSGYQTQAGSLVLPCYHTRYL